MATVLELKEQACQLRERMKEMLDLAEGENRDLTGEEEANWKKVNDDMNSMEARIERQERMERTPSRDPDPKGILSKARTPQEVRATPEYAQAFRRYLAFQEEPDDRALLRGQWMGEGRAMQINTPTAGGYFVPEGFARRIEEALLAFGGMRSVATIMPTDTGEDIHMPTSNDTTNTGEILAEGTQVSEQDATIGVRVLKAFMYSSKRLNVSLQLLQDSAFDIEGWLAGLLAIRIGRITNTHFTTGVGANQPSGIANDATLGVTGATGQTTSVTWDELIDLEHTVDPAYRSNARYMFRDATLQFLRKVKDGEGRYLWQPAQPTGGFPATVNGFPYTLNSDVAAMAASARSIFFGDLRKYIIRDVRGFALRRLEELRADYAQVVFLGFSRHDGVLLDAGTNPVKYYANAAS